MEQPTTQAEHKSRQVAGRDDGPVNKYFSIVPHIDDDDLDLYEYRLLGHYRKLFGLGLPPETNSQTAIVTGMSIKAVRAARQRLVEKRRITINELTGVVVLVSLVDVMAENVRRYTNNPSPKRQGLDMTYPYPKGKGGYAQKGRGGMPKREGVTPDEPSSGAGKMPPKELEEEKNTDSSSLHSEESRASAQSASHGTPADPGSDKIDTTPQSKSIEETPPPIAGGSPSYPGSAWLKCESDSPAFVQEPFEVWIVREDSDNWYGHLMRNPELSEATFPKFAWKITTAPPPPLDLEVRRQSSLPPPPSPQPLTDSHTLPPAEPTPAEVAAALERQAARFDRHEAGAVLARAAQKAEPVTFKRGDPVWYLATARGGWNLQSNCYAVVLAVAKKVTIGVKLEKGGFKKVSVDLASLSPRERAGAVETWERDALDNAVPVVKPKAERARDLVFDAIAAGSFGMGRVANGSGGRVAKLVKGVTECAPEEQRATLAADLEAAYKWWRETKRKNGEPMGTPAAVETICSMLHEWREKQTKPTEPNRPKMLHEMTEEELKAHYNSHLGGKHDRR